MLTRNRTVEVQMRSGRFLCQLAAVGTVCLTVLGAAAPPAWAATPQSVLLARYEPVTQFDPLETFAPTRVQSFIVDSELEQLVAPGTWRLVRARAAPGDLPSDASAVWRLNQRTCTPTMPLGGLACYTAAWQQGGGGPVVYGRVAHEGDRLVLQYWYFYYDDVYSYTYPPSDFIWQAHEGDWEVVNVVLSNEEQPLYVGYSEHCLGARRDWSDTPRFDDTHPLVHVALGSHANYFTAGVHPINPRCIPDAALAILRLQHLPLPADYAFAGPLAGPPAAHATVVPIEQIGDKDPSWLAFPGFWGESQYFHAPAPIGTIAFGNSPVGPAFQAVWRDPVGTIAAWSAG
jgi:hypothetical protein